MNEKGAQWTVKEERVNYEHGHKCRGAAHNGEHTMGSGREYEASISLDRDIGKDKTSARAGSTPLICTR